MTPRQLLRRAWPGAVLLAVMLQSHNVAADVDVEAARLLFNQGAVPACAICHTLADAGAEGQIGPSLDELKPDAQRVENALRAGLGVMPDYSALSDEEIALLARYIEAATHAQ